MRIPVGIPMSMGTGIRTDCHSFSVWMRGFKSAVLCKVRPDSMCCVSNVVVSETFCINTDIDECATNNETCSA